MTRLTTKANFRSKTNTHSPKANHENKNAEAWPRGPAGRDHSSRAARCSNLHEPAVWPRRVVVGDGYCFDLVGTNHGTPFGGVSFAPGGVGRAFAFATTNDWIHRPQNPATLFTSTVAPAGFR